MLRASLALLIAAPLLAPAPAFAADMATLGCVDPRIDAKTRATLVADIERNLSNPSGKQSYSPDAVTAIRAAAMACKAAHGWSDKATTAALMYAISQLSWPTALRLAKEKGVAHAAIERRFMALPADVQRSALAGGEAFRTVAREAEAAGEINGSNAATAGALLGVVAVRENALVDFKAN